jgi:hypothetical protein
VTYFFTFAHRFFCAAEILARAAADIVRLPAVFGVALPFNAEIAASTPPSFRTRVARSRWSMFNKSVVLAINVDEYYKNYKVIAAYVVFLDQAAGVPAPANGR